MSSPETDAPARSIYEILGGETTLRRLTKRFYELMDELPEAAACRAIHPASLDESREKLFEYLSGWFGGPQLFVERRGPPMLRRRHFVASIGPEERDGWILCFRQAWAETIYAPEVTAMILPRIEHLAMHMQNRD